MPLPHADKKTIALKLSHVLARACAGDIDGANTLVVEIYAEYGKDGMWALCCATTELTLDLMGVDTRPDTAFMRFAFVDAETGALVEPEDIDRDDPGYAVLWASRFLSATYNRDPKAQIALFEAAYASEEDITSLVSGIVLLAIQSISRHPDFPGLSQ